MAKSERRARRVSLPTFDQFIEPILRHLAQHPNGLPARDMHEAAADRLELSTEQREEVIPSGQLVYKNRSGWAHDRLKRDGLSSSPSRGFWCLTDKGREYARTHPNSLPAAEIARLAFPRRFPSNETSTTSDPANVEVSEPLLSPEEQIETALQQIQESVATDLLERLHQVSPTYFEVIVLDLLHKMGYGANRGDLKRVGGSGDGGIDGVINLDKLGLEKVYVQAKRWQGTVGRPEIQSFYGALAGRRATKGVFLTTSSFSREAIEFAASVERVVLVDGRRLANLMIEHEVGVSLKPLFRPELDGDYFDES